MATKMRPRELEIGMRITANLWGLSKTEPKRIVQVGPFRNSRTVTVWVEGWDEPVGMSCNTAVWVH